MNAQKCIIYYELFPNVCSIMMAPEMVACETSFTNINLFINLLYILIVKFPRTPKLQLILQSFQESTDILQDSSISVTILLSMRIQNPISMNVDVLGCYQLSQIPIASILQQMPEN